MSSVGLAAAGILSGSPSRVRRTGEWGISLKDVKEDEIPVAGSKVVITSRKGKTWSAYLGELVFRAKDGAFAIFESVSECGECGDPAYWREFYGRGRSKDYCPPCNLEHPSFGSRFAIPASEAVYRMDDQTAVVTRRMAA